MRLPATDGGPASARDVTVRNHPGSSGRSRGRASRAAGTVGFAMPRLRPLASPGETDVFGAQQYAPLFEVEVP